MSAKEQSTDSKTNLRTYVFPELGISVEAASLAEAEAKAKKETK